MRLGVVCLCLALAVGPAGAHHSWFSRTWRWMTGAKESGDQCLVSCAAASGEDGTTCAAMWSSLSQVLTGAPEQVPDHLFRGKRDAMTAVQRRETQRKMCCFLTEFPSAMESCCTLLRHYCNAMPFEDDEDTDSRQDKIKGGIRGIADKIGVNIDDLGLTWDEKQKIKDQLVE